MRFFTTTLKFVSYILARIVGPILFNIFVNDLFIFINKAKLANFADNNTIYANSAEMKTLLDILEKESDAAIKWFKQNEVIVKPGKFQEMVLGRQKKKEKINFTINGAEIKGQNSAALLETEREIAFFNKEKHKQN